MTPTSRLAVALAGLAVWATMVVPGVEAAVSHARLTRLEPPRPAEVRARLALLPKGVESPELVELSMALDLDDALADAERMWGWKVAAVLEREELEEGLGIADLASPPPPPPPEAPTADGDLVALARALLDRYGYVAAPAPRVTTDPWPGKDRRTRARAIRALAEGPGIDRDDAHVILAATLVFLEEGERRAANLDRIAELLPVVMGEKAR